MVSRFIRWLRSWTGSSEPSPGISTSEPKRKVEGLEQEIRKTDPGFRGIPLNRPGDLSMRAGHKKRALQYLGRAIDSCLEDEPPEAARAGAQKLIRVHAGALRTLCTITWLDLAGG